jgi:DAACS family dicarboxylate/amino acid:cation (Na+ or H+) symporter
MARAFDPTYTGGGLLAIMFFALMIGAAMTTLESETVSTVRGLLEGLYQICMRVIGFAMKLAPVGVGALLFSLTASFSFSMIGTVLQFMLVVLAALALHLFVTYSILLRTLGRMSPVFFFRNSLDVMLTAFSTSSSNATLPTALAATIEKLKVPKDAAHFVLTIGSTANQNGTALYEGVTVLFLAQCFGIPLDLGQQVVVVLLSILGGVGTAGVPGGSLPVIAMILLTVGIPAEGIAVIYGVDRILDMSRTVVNVTGDMAAAVYVGRSSA